MPTPSGPVQLPELDEYEILAPIARGGMAEVFLGRLRTRPDRLVAREMDGVRPRALAAALTHPLSADLVRFALGASATAMRTRLGTD